jgi:hypothetical protein
MNRNNVDRVGQLSKLSWAQKGGTAQKCGTTEGLDFWCVLQHFQFFNSLNRSEKVKIPRVIKLKLLVMTYLLLAVCGQAK